MRNFIFICLFSFCSVLFADNADCTFVRGDLTNDGVVTQLDFSALVDYLQNGTSFVGSEDSADLNDDGIINNKDKTYLRKFLNNGGPDPLAPYPNLGLDCTGDLLAQCCSMPDEVLGSLVSDTVTDSGSWSVQNSSFLNNNALFSYYNAASCTSSNSNGTGSAVWLVNDPVKFTIRELFWDATVLLGSVDYDVLLEADLDDCISTDTNELTLDVDLVLLVSSSEAPSIEITVVVPVFSKSLVYSEPDTISESDSTVPVNLNQDVINTITNDPRVTASMVVNCTSEWSILSVGVNVSSSLDVFSNDTVERETVSVELLPSVEYSCE